MHCGALEFGTVAPSHAVQQPIVCLHVVVTKQVPRGRKRFKIQLALALFNLPRRGRYVGDFATRWQLERSTKAKICNANAKRLRINKNLPKVSTDFFTTSQRREMRTLCGLRSR